MHTKVLRLSDLKFNLETWRRELRFHLSEMDTFEEKLEEIAARGYSKSTSVPLEQFQNRIMIEKDVISKLKHRCKHKIALLSSPDSYELLEPKFHDDHQPLMDDMRTYIKMHYELIEEMMTYFLNWLE
ncbi:hypothetical protein MC378_04965 [Polaribacter sp. MSW13]|uniref:Uncharacterized protein n=1 Tax=Polaribacter marinus TaxID=2916838 RepID=A0A9X2AJL2_9FLAO|nr:hypothetical protein [Polaribacter marinus]MCI2228508.1 hypothetical protein [Polaribacter marinus]